MNKLEEKAVEACLKADFQAAIEINNIILRENPKDIDALNRLAFAYIQNGNKTLAAKAIRQALLLDKFNSIALKNQQFLKTLPKKLKKSDCAAVTKADFIEEPCITKIINLTDLCNFAIFSKIRNGTELQLKIRRRKICIYNNNSYLGKLTDDLSFRLIKAISHGNRFSVYFKSCENKKVTVFLKETFHNPQKNQEKVF